jgi:cell division protein FtsB
MKTRLAAWVILIVGTVVAFNMGMNVWRLFGASGRLRDEERLLAEAVAERAQLKKKLDEVQSPDFVEKEAREKLGLGRAGEEVIVIPNDVLGGDRVGEVQTEDPSWVKWRRLYLGF